MRKMELKRMKKRILMMWMKKKKVVMRMKKEMRMVKSRMVMQKKDLQRKKRMKWIQRDRRQKMGLQLEFSLPISSVPSISPPPFQPVLALSISLWLHTISDEGRLEMLSNREDSCFLLTRRSSPSVTFPSSEIIPDPTSLQLCPINKCSSSLVVSWGPVPELARLFTWQASLLPLSLALLFFVASMTEILDSFCFPDLLLGILPEARRLQAQIWCIFLS
ncbi:hypothetical protein A306_00003651 [Columba livia]|uniref:Uncharacterized protein n=1 Tax=Columba livia TaxID=8932 RepID=A0A2I0ML93_COLLI|nr:hypothetical protein A306_00003651 [Columba livia]